MTDYSKMVSALAKSGAEILNELTPADAHALHMSVGISGEAGELLDAIKKGAVYRTGYDRDNIIEELGDLEFYMEGLRQGFGITRQETLDANVAKLAKQYAAGNYSDEAAQARADKAPNVAETVAQDWLNELVAEACDKWEEMVAASGMSPDMYMIADPEARQFLAVVQEAVQDAREAGLTIPDMPGLPTVTLHER